MVCSTLVAFLLFWKTHCFVMSLLWHAYCIFLSGAWTKIMTLDWKQGMGYWVNVLCNLNGLIWYACSNHMPLLQSSIAVNFEHKLCNWMSLWLESFRLNDVPFCLLLGDCSPGETLIASSSRDKTIRLWTVQSGQSIKTLVLPNNSGHHRREEAGLKARVWITLCWPPNSPLNLVSSGLK